MSKIKTFFLVVVGNILEYYDFLLFAHIGYLITPLFIPAEYYEQSHLFALLMFSLPFIVRPIGGYIFGKIADKTTTSNALDSTLCYASITSLLIAILPHYSTIGILSTILFVVLRSFQGFALGGEYTTAGTYLMNNYSQRRCLISGILGASGTIGSIIAFIFATIYAKFYKGTELWRIFFIFGGVATYISYYLRKQNFVDIKKANYFANNVTKVNRMAILQTLFLGAITSVSCFVPMVYSNFYFTQILGFSSDIGFIATMISLVTYIIFTPIFGYYSDKIDIRKSMTRSFLIAIPFVIFGFQLLWQGYLFGQIPLTMAASIAGANIHVIMNQLFPPQVRSQNVNLYFTSGSSFGGMVPVLSGYLSMHYGFLYTPFIAIITLLIVNAYLFYPKKQFESENLEAI